MSELGGTLLRNCCCKVGALLSCVFFLFLGKNCRFWFRFWRGETVVVAVVASKRRNSWICCVLFKRERLNFPQFCRIVHHRRVTWPACVVVAVHFVWHLEKFEKNPRASLSTVGKLDCRETTQGVPAPKHKLLRSIHQQQYLQSSVFSKKLIKNCPLFV